MFKEAPKGRDKKFIEADKEEYSGNPEFYKDGERVEVVVPPKKKDEEE